MRFESYHGNCWSVAHTRHLKTWNNMHMLLYEFDRFRSLNVCVVKERAVKTFFRIVPFVFHRRKAVIQILNGMTGVLLK